MDGKQRLTSLAIAFGGLRAPKGTQLFSGSWFIDFTQDPDASDEFIKYKRKLEVQSGKLDQLPNCLALGLLPLDEYKNLDRLSQRIYDKSYYPKEKVPADGELDNRSVNLAKYQATFNGYQIPVAELPSSVSLSDICEIFEVLNTTGTKVSTFDLIHNTFFGQTKGTFSLRDKFDDMAASTTTLRLLLRQSRPEYFCQLVTGIYLSTEGPKKTVASIKGKDLLATPLDIYEEILENLPLIDSWARDLFTDVIGTEASLDEIPYPASIILYFSLRWRQDRVLKQDSRFTVGQLNRLFKAFFWRNVLSNRYDQGFLTKLATDLAALTKILEGHAKESHGSWLDAVQEEFSAVFDPSYPEEKVERISERLRSEEIRGALWQGFTLFLFSSVRVDLLSGEQLDRHSDNDKQRIELHHVYPKQWLRSNASSEDQKKDYLAALSCIANLIPMSAASNKRWGTKAPAAMAFEQKMAWEDKRSVLQSMFITEQAFKSLIKDDAKPEDFWKARADQFAQQIGALQRVQ